MSRASAPIKSQAADIWWRVMKVRHEMLWILVGQALGFVGGFVGIKVLTNLMGPQRYGQLALGLTIAGLLNLFVYGPLSNVVARFYSICRESGRLNEYFDLFKKSHVILATILVAAALIAGGIGWVLAGKDWGLLISVATLFGVATGINTSYVSLQSAMRDRKLVALHQGADVWLRIGISIVLLFFLKNTGYVALTGYLLGTLLVTASQRFFALKKPDVKSNWQGSKYEQSLFQECRQYAAPFILWAGISYVTVYGDRWVLQGLFGEKEVGIYAALFQIATSPINILYTMVNQMMMPILFDRVGDLSCRDAISRTNGFLHQVVMVVVGISVVVVVAFYILSEFIVRLLTSSEFAVYHQALWMIALALCVFNVAQLLTAKGLYYNQPKIYILPKALHAVSFIVCSLSLGAKYGLVGVPISLCVSSAAYLLSVHWVNRRLDEGPGGVC